MTKNHVILPIQLKRNLFPLSRFDTIKPNAIIMPLTMKLLMGSELRNVSPIPEFLSNAIDRKSGMGDTSTYIAMLRQQQNYDLQSHIFKSRRSNVISCTSRQNG